MPLNSGRGNQIVRGTLIDFQYQINSAQTQTKIKDKRYPNRMYGTPRPKFYVEKNKCDTLQGVRQDKIHLNFCAQIKCRRHSSTKKDN